MWLRTSAGTWTQTTAVRVYKKSGHVYNLTVDHLHTYYVEAGAASVLVHNSACGIAAFADVSSLPNQAFSWSGVPEEEAALIVQSMGGETLQSLTRAHGTAMPGFNPGVPSIVDAWTMICARYAAGASVAYM